MENLVKVLLVEDNKADAELIQRELRKSNSNYQFLVTENKRDYIDGLINYDPDLIISDHSLPDFDSIEAIKIAKDIYCDIPCVLLTGSISEERANESIKAGFDDYILKDSLLRLPGALDGILKNKLVKEESERVEMIQMETAKALKEVEEVNRNITASICYAKHIQDAMLPEKTILSSVFPESFVLYKPKDILSGDFYWYTKQDDKFIVIAADCTGHGVPGAMVSMVGYAILNHIVKLKGITSPAQILNKLDKAVKRILKQNDESCGAHDGLDISVCAIDVENKTISFSGANRPLLHLSNGIGTLHAGNKEGIGGMQSKLPANFSEISIPFENGDTIYMFSDGYADQFGGPLNKKLMKKNLIKLIEDVQDNTLEEQETIILKKHLEWKGETEQTDDILVIGLKL